MHSDSRSLTSVWVERSVVYCGGKEKGGTAVETKKGDVFKSTLNGADYIVKKIVNSMVLLESQDGKKHIVTGVTSLNIKSFYENREGTKR